jgi:AcrR family transcriptional regulator
MQRRGQGGSKTDEGRVDTRQQLLEAAGQVFAEKGFDRATGKEITERARTNTAAVNYYFGGMEGLYGAVFEEAMARLVRSDALVAAVAGKADAKAKLEAFLELLVQAVTGPSSTSWVLRVFGREAVLPAACIAALREKERLRRVRVLKAIVSEVIGLPEDHPAVARGCISVIAPCILLLICDRPSLRQMFPSLGFAPEDAPALTRHMVQFALAGLSAIASDAKREETEA